MEQNQKMNQIRPIFNNKIKTRLFDKIIASFIWLSGINFIIYIAHLPIFAYIAGNLAGLVAVAILIKKK